MTDALVSPTTQASDNDEESTPESTPEETAAVPLPADVAAWRILLAQVPPKDLLRVVQQDRFLTARVLTGFRAASDSFRRPQVLDRLSKEIGLIPKVAEAVATLHHAHSTASTTDSTEKATLPETAAQPASPASEPSAEEDKSKNGTVLRETVNRQKAVLREKEARIAELETALAVIRKEREQVQTERDTARAAQKTAEAEAERQARLLEREQRKQTVAKAATETAPKAALTTPAAPVIIAPPVSSVLEEALTRLLNRARWETVADICREALGQGATGDPLAPLARGRIHAFYASALYGQGDVQNAEEQDKLATSALLDAGDAPGAAEALARMLTHTATVKPIWTTLLKRLEPLAARNGQAEAVQEVFRRLHIASPDAYRRLLAALGTSGGKRSSSLIATLRTPDLAPFTPDESVLLTAPAGIALAVTARKIAEAVETGDEEWVLRLHQVLAALKKSGGTDAQIVDRLLASVADVLPVAAQPFLHTVLRAVLVDASNVARHNPDPLAQYLSAGSKQPQTARIRQLTQMRDFLMERGYFPVLLIADATLGFHADDADTYRTLVTRHVVYEVPSGTSADEVLISEARLRHAPLVSNDTFTDWGNVSDIDRFHFDFGPGRVALTPVK